MFLMMLVAIAMISCSKEDPVESTPTIIITLSSENVPYGSNITVSWTSTNAKTVTLNGEAVATSGSKDYSNMTSTTKFSATATNVVKTASAEKTVTVGDEPAPVVVITTTPNDAVLPYGNKVTISWSVTNAKTVTLDGVVVAATGTKVVQPLANTTYTLKAVNVTKETIVSKVITVSAWNTTKFGLLTHNGKKWVMNSYDSYKNQVLIRSLSAVNADQDGWYYIYKPDNFYVFARPDGTLLSVGVTTWEFVENETQLRIHSASNGSDLFMTFWIVTLNETTLSLVMLPESTSSDFYTIRIWKIE